MKIGSYEIDQPLGQGTAAETFLTQGGSKVMIVKKLHAELARDAKVNDRFLDACNVTSKIKNKRFLATVVMQKKDAEGTYIVREHVEGRTLAQLQQEGKLGGIDGKQLAFELCDALRALHLQGIIHGGIHPANIVLDPDGHLKLMDYGIGRAILTGQIDAGYPLSALRYLSPEQWWNQAFGPPADLYSAGLVIALVLDGHEIVDGKNQAEIRTRVLAGVKTARAELAKAIALDPKDRYGRAEDMRAALKGMFEPAEAPPAAPAKTAAVPPAKPQAAAPPPASPPLQPGSLTAIIDFKADTNKNLLELGKQSWRLRRTRDPQQWPIYFTNGGPGELALQLTCEGSGIHLTPTDRLIVPAGESRYVIVNLEVQGSAQAALNVAWGARPEQSVRIAIDRPEPRA